MTKIYQKGGLHSGELASSRTLAPLCPHDFCLFTRYGLDSRGTVDVP